MSVMRLSDAAVLGAQTWKRVCYPVQFKTQAETKGCFLQLALRAVGCSAQEVSEDSNEQGVPLWAIKVQEFWPWTSNPSTSNPYAESHDSIIWKMNDSSRPFEEILAYVRQHEPVEQSESQLPSAVGATPDSSAETIALPEDKLEAMVESWRDAESNT